MLIATAHAQAGGAPAAFDFVSLMPLVLIFVVFYFLLIRPQQKKMRQHREMIASLKRGDKILTSGGIIGTIVKVEEEEGVLLVEIAKDVRVRVARATVSDLIGKPAAASGGAQAPAAAGASGKPANDPSTPAAGGAGKGGGLMSRLLGR
jgi:preprotein translocase subunit YajC